jgi:protein-S-isoprenylcysteine O-methyltransferase Ste14
VALSTGPAIACDLGLLALFYGAHSGFASVAFKRRVGRARDAMRRLYLVLTLPVMLVVWASWAPLGQPVLWDVRASLSVPFIAIRIGAAAGLVWTVRSFSLTDFFGESRAGAPRPGVRLSTGGAFALCRHPLYLFMSLLAAATTVMPLGRALMAGSLLIYVVVGSRSEERKLELEFGADYRCYRALTPWLIPTPSSIARALRAPITRDD